MNKLNLFIVKYQNDKWSISTSKDECFIDEEISNYICISENKYREILNSFGAKQYHHIFTYADNDVKEVQDSYFETIEQCKKALDYLYGI